MPGATRRGFIGFGRFLFRFRRTVFPLLIAPLVLLLPPVMPAGSPVIETVFDAAGVLALLAGLGVRAAVIGLEYIERGGRHGKVYASKLVTGGIFGVCRNPIYVGNIALLCAPVLIASNPWVALVGLPLAVLGYSAIVAAEETFLVREFGQAYRDYCRRVNRWRPSLARLGPAFAGQRFNWARVVIRDYNTIFLWAVITWVVLLREHIRASDGPGIDSVCLVYALVFIVLCVAYITARVCKKRNLLTERGWRGRANKPA